MTSLMTLTRTRTDWMSGQCPCMTCIWQSQLQQQLLQQPPLRPMRQHEQLLLLRQAVHLAALQQGQQPHRQLQMQQVQRRQQQQPLVMLLLRARVRRAVRPGLAVRQVQQLLVLVLAPSWCST